MHVRLVLKPLAAAAVFAAGTAGIFAITNGTPDGNAHPAVGVIVGTDSDADNCSGSHQLTGFCSAVLIAPDVVLTTGDCVIAFSEGITDGLVDEVWVIFDEHPLSTGAAFDCTKFVNVSESGLFPNPTYVASPSTGVNIGVMLLETPLVGVAPAELPVENRLQTLPRGQDELTFVSMGHQNPPPPGVLVSHTLARRSGVGRTSPPLEPLEHPVTITSPAGACFGAYGYGGGTFVGSTNEVVSVTEGTYEIATCNSPAAGPRLDVPDARDFLDDFVTLP